MMKKAIFAILAIAMMAMMLVPAQAFIYPDCHSDYSFEQFGPRAEKLLIHLYADDTTEFTAMETHQIDIADWPISKAIYDVMSTMPYLKIVNYGSEYGLYILDMNVNNNTYLGNPPDPAYVNPADVKVLNPGNGVKYNWMADVWLRRAIDYLINRAAYILNPSIGAGFGSVMYTTIAPPLLKYLLDVTLDPSIPWAYTYSRLLCNQTLDAHGYKIGPSGFREYRGQQVILQFYIRNDHPGRMYIGQSMVAEMTACGFNMGAGNVHYLNSGGLVIAVMVNKDFHLATCGWSLSTQPDYLILWDWAYYWHPGQSYNYGGYNDAAFNAAAEGVMYANTQAEAVSMSLTAQYRQAYMVLGAPVYCVAGNKVYHKQNTGGNAGDTTEGQNWLGVVNIQGYGIDNGWSFMDMHTDVTEQGGGMTIDYGFKVPELKQVNIIYANWLYDSNVLGQMYESLLASNASNVAALMPWLASSYTVDTYFNPGFGNCSRVRFTLRPNIYWSDGLPITVADVYFSMVEIKTILTSRHFPNPWWWSNVQDILSFTILDPYNFEVLLDVKTYWALYLIGGTYILPKHIWKPIILTADPTVTVPDDKCVASGPWMFHSVAADYVPNSHVVLYMNPGFVGEEPEWFHRPGPIYVTVKANAGNLNKFPLGQGLNPIVITMYNMMAPNMTGHAAPIVVSYMVLQEPTTGGYFNDTLAPEDITIASGSNSIPAGGSVTVTVPFTWAWGQNGIEVLANWTSVVPCPTPKTDVDSGPTGAKWKLVWEEIFYVTIAQDIKGSTWYDDMEYSAYPYKTELQTPNFFVDISDLSAVAGAFGAYPGASKWKTNCDIDHNYFIDIKDVASVAAKFGWFMGAKP